MSDFYNKYPYTDFHELNLDWIIERVKKLTEDWAATLEEWNSTEEQWQDLYDYVHDYFDNLNVQQEINNKINAMIADGTFVTITTPVIEAKVASMMPGVVSDQIGGVVANQIGGTVANQLPGVVSDQIDSAVVNPVNAWLNDHITQPTTPVVDTSLTIAGAAADAAVTGNMFNDMHYYEITKNSIDWKEISGTVYNKVVNFNDGSAYPSNRHGVYDVTSLQGDIVRISGRSATVNASLNYGLYAFYDSSNQLISSYGADNTTYECALAVVPSNAVKLIINCDNASVTLGLYKIDYPASGIGEKANVAYNYAVSDTSDPGSHLFIDTIQPTSIVGLMDFKTGTIYGSTSGRKVTVSPGDVCLISGQTATISSSMDYNLYGFYDSADNLIEHSHFTTSYESLNNIRAVAPAGASYCWINGGSGIVASLKIRTSTDIKSYIDANKNVWYGKKIGIVGTSVAFGAYATKSYSDEASKILGYDLKMFAVPGLAIETESDGSPKQYGSLTLSIAEYVAAGWSIPAAPVTPYVPGGSYNDYYRTYENIFTADNADVDLWVFAVAPNNTNFATTDWDLFDKDNWRYTDNTPFADHRKTFIGALLFLMDQMYTLNPQARMIFLLDSAYQYSTGKQAFERLKATWNIIITDLWGRINISPISFTQLKSQGGTNLHPSTFAHEIMGRMFAGELESIS